jgi:hypothetical protein
LQKSCKKLSKKLKNNNLKQVGEEGEGEEGEEGDL